MSSKHNAEKSVIVKRFIRTVQNKIYKYMTSISKNVYIDKLGDIDNKYNNTYRRTIKMIPVDIKPSTYIDSRKEINDEDTKFKIDDIVRISKYKNLFTKRYVPDWSEKVFLRLLCYSISVLLTTLFYLASSFFILDLCFLYT